MKVLQIHDEIQVNEDAERVVATGNDANLCCAPGLGLWAGRHLFYVKAYLKDDGMHVFPIVGDEYSEADICKMLLLKKVSIFDETLIGIDFMDVELLQQRIGVEIIVEMPEAEAKPHSKKKGKA